MALIKTSFPAGRQQRVGKPPSYWDSKTQALDLTPSKAFAFVKTVIALPTCLHIRRFRR
jgi:hypothetical protein